MSPKILSSNFHSLTVESIFTGCIVTCYGNTRVTDCTCLPRLEKNITRNPVVFHLPLQSPRVWHDHHGSWLCLGGVAVQGCVSYRGFLMGHGSAGSCHWEGGASTFSRLQLLLPGLAFRAFPWLLPLPVACLSLGHMDTGHILLLSPWHSLYRCSTQGYNLSYSYYDTA